MIQWLHCLNPNVKYLFLVNLMHCIEMQCLTIALVAVIYNPIAMVDAFAKFHRLHVGVVDCRMWVISRRLTMCASCWLCWLCVQHVTECIDTYCIAATGEIVVQVEVEACWLWSWDCCLLTWQGDKVKWHFLKRECVCKVVKVGGARTDFRSASFLNSFKCCLTHTTLWP